LIKSKDKYSREKRNISIYIIIFISDVSSNHAAGLLVIVDLWYDWYLLF